MKYSNEYSDSYIISAFGKEIREYRISINYTQSDFAEKCGISLSTLERIENGNDTKFSNIIKIWKRELKDKKYRDEYGEYIVEGIKLIGEAVKENANIAQIVVCDGCDKSEIIENHLRYEMAKYECVYVPQNIFKIISSVENPQGIMAVIKKESNEEEIDFNEDVIVALDDIQDPGNLGTILRTVDSVGLKQILVSKGTADSFNPKVVRSTMGAIFRVKVIECENLPSTLKETQKNGYKVMVTSLEAKHSIYNTDYNKKVIVIGNEANGVSKEVQKLADEKVIILFSRSYNYHPFAGATEKMRETSVNDFDQACQYARADKYFLRPEETIDMIKNESYEICSLESIRSENK